MALYRSPTASMPLADAPRLATWDAKDHPSQLQMAKYLATIREVLAPAVTTSAGEPLALRLDVGLPDTTPLIGAGGDLDNYLYPVAAHLGATRFVTAWATKRHGRSMMGVERAEPLSEGLDDSWAHQRARTTVAADSKRWKEQLASQVASVDTGSEAVELHVAYRLHARRNWSALWKPTIDSLGAVLGEGPRPFHPRDDRITLLALHRSVDDSIGWDVEIDLWARAACAQ